MTLLIASAIDGNSHIMPLAFALVESESTASYEYFFEHLREHVICERKVAIISDRHAGILSVLKRPEWAGVAHKFCIRHFYSNFQTKFRNKVLKKLADKAGRAYQKHKYKRYMAAIEIRSPEAYAWLTKQEKRPKEKWTRVYDKKGQRHNVMTTNYVESVNATLKNIRGLPITSMLEAIFARMVKMFDTRWKTYEELIATNVHYTPICIQLLKQRGEKARFHTSQTYDRSTMTCKVETRKNHSNGRGGNTHTVNLQHKKCTCQLSLLVGRGHLGVRILPHLADLGRLRDISWGSAVLAYLYHELCLCASASANRQNIGGAVWILQLWAYERLRPLQPRLADFDVTGGLPLGDRWGGPRQRERGTRRVPRHSVSYFRLLLDGLRYDDIVWQPYSDDVLQSIPQMYLTGRHIWRARVPMIYYHIVEWHQPDRVLQQFGLQQPIPLPAMQDRRLHNIQYQGNYNFDELLSDYIQIWNNRAAYVVQGYQLQRPPHYHSAYMEWFRSRSRRWITHEGAAAGQSRDTFEMISLQREARASRIGTAARSSQLAYGEERRDVTLPPPEPAVPAYVLPPLPLLTIDLAHIRGARRRQPRAAPPRERPADPIPPPVYFHFDPTATTDRRGEYYGPTQYYGSTSASQPPWHQTSFPQGPQVSSYQVPPSSMPFFEPSYGQTAYTTPLGTPPSQFHQGTPPASQFRQATPPASQFRQATPPASQFRQATPPASPFQLTTPPPFAASDQYYRPAPYTDAQPFTSFDQCYRPTMPSDDQPSTSHSRPSSSHQAQDPSQLHFTLSESWLFGPEIGSEAYEELLSRPDLTPPSFRLLPPTQEETGTAPPAADVQHSAQDVDAHDSGESPPVPRQFHSITDRSRHRRETHGLRIQRPRTRRYED
ncbi:uncharacterized protein LOC126672672 [Mercurialis annua]|uniref:uncharacterized protein LOC126672672 n=1 Tax=Mercurialis annua TaxID=3986 RepID=UPI0024AECF34|nr:uncharacterized protein LOC126672672 [Mercurialis annua]